MLTTQEISHQLKDRRIDKVAEATGLHYNTVKNMRDNPESNPTLRVLKALSDYLEPR